MRKLKILKNILFVWFFLLIGFGGYCLYYLFTIKDILMDKYIKLNENTDFNKLIFNSVEDYRLFLQDKFSWSLLSLLILYIMIILFIFVFYFHFKNLYLFYVCDECTTGIVTYKDYIFSLEYIDKKNKNYKNHFSRNQSLYKKIYKKRNGEIDIFYNKYNPKNFIIGNKPTFLVEYFLKPFFLDLFTFILIFGGIYFLHPFLFLLVI